MALDQAFAQKVNDFIHGVAAAPALAAGRKVKICSNVGTATTAGTEVATNANYPAGGVAVGWNGSTAATPTVSGNQAVAITNVPAWPSIASVEITDNASSPVRIEFGPINGGPKSSNAGDTVSFSAGALASALG